MHIQYIKVHVHVYLNSAHTDGRTATCKFEMYVSGPGPSMVVDEVQIMQLQSCFFYIFYMIIHKILCICIHIIYVMYIVQ